MVEVALSSSQFMFSHWRTSICVYRGAVPDTNAEGHPVVHTNKSSNGRRLIYKRMTGNTLAISITDVADESLKFEWFKLRGLCSKQICKSDDQIRTFSATLGGEGEYSLTSFNCQTVRMDSTNVFLKVMRAYSSSRNTAKISCYLFAFLQN